MRQSNLRTTGSLLVRLLFGRGCPTLGMVVLTAAASALASVRGPEAVTLPNGLKVILVENKATPVFTATAVVRTGVIDEAPEMNGAVHLLEHMLFNGTSRRTQKALYDEVDGLGAYNNAFTRDAYTCFQFLVASSHAREALDIQSDMLYNSVLPAENFEKEKGIVREEMRKDAARPSSAANAAARARLYAGTPLARPALGTEASIGGIARDELLRFYKTYYVPSNTILLLMGDFDRKTILDEVKTTFGAFPAGTPTKVPELSVLWPTAPTLAKLPDPDAKSVQLDVAMPAPGGASDDCVPFVLLTSLLDHGFRSGLKDRLASAGVPVVSAGASYDMQPGHLSTMTVSLELPKDGDPVAALRALSVVLHETAAGAFLPDEVDAVRRGLVAEEIYNLEKPHYYSMFKASLLAAGPYELFSSYETRLQSCPHEAVLAAARAWLPDGLRRMLATAAVSPPAKASEAALELPAAPAAQPGAAPSLTRVVLDSGLTLVVDEKPGSGVFSVHVLCRNRSAMEPPGKEGIADFTHRMLPMGTRLRDRSMLDQSLEEIGAQLKVTDNPFIPFDDYYFSPEYSYVRFNTLTPYWEKGIALLGEMMNEPSFAPERVEEVRKDMMMAVMRSARSPEEIDSRLMAGLWLLNGPGSRPIRGTTESVTAITAGDIETFHRELFAPRNLVISVVGGIPRADVQAAVARHLVKAPTGSPAATEGAGQGQPGATDQPVAAVPTLPTAPPKPEPVAPEGRVARVARVDERGLPQAHITLGVPLALARELRPGALVANAILSNRLAFELREKKGMAYSIGSSVVRVGAGDDSAYLVSVGMGTGAENLEAAEAGILAEIDRMASAFPEAAEIERNKNRLVGSTLMRSLSSEQQAYRIGLSAFRMDPEDQLDRYFKEIAGVSVEDVRKIVDLLSGRKGFFVTTVK